MRVRTRNEELSGRFFLLERVDPERARPKKKYSYGPLPLADGSLSCLNKTPKTHTRIHNKKGRVKRESSCCCGGGGLVLSQIKPYFDDVFRFSSVSREYVLRTEREEREKTKHDVKNEPLDRSSQDVPRDHQPPNDSSFVKKKIAMSVVGLNLRIPAKEDLTALPTFFSSTFTHTLFLSHTSFVPITHTYTHT